MKAKDVLRKKIKKELETFKFQSCDNCFWNEHNNCGNPNGKSGKIWVAEKCNRYMMGNKVFTKVAERILSLMEEYDNGKIKRPKNKPMPARED